MFLTDVDQRRDIAEIFLPPVGVDLSPEFMAALLPRPKEKLITGGVQAGKSYEGAAEFFLDICYVQPGKRYLYWNIVPSYKAEHTEMDYLRRWCEEQGIVHRAHWPTNDQLRLELFNGNVVLETKTAENIPGISGQPCDGVLVTEAGSLPPAIRQACLERTMTKDGWITYTGSLENEGDRPQFTWYGETAALWKANPSHEHMAIALPSWANRTVHPEGENSPRIKYLKQELDPFEFNRRIAGVPAGAQFPIYPVIANSDNKERWAYHKEVHGTDFIGSMSAGGHDYGGAHGHPSALVVVQVTAGMAGFSTAVVREAWAYQGSDRSLITMTRNLLSQKYAIPKWRWGFDPVQRQAAEEIGAYALKSGAGSREARVGLVEARINNGTLLFDFAGPGVLDVWLQMRTVHRRKRFVPGQGEIYDYARIDDDYVAALEDAIEVIDTKGPVARPKQPRTNWGKPLVVR